MSTIEIRRHAATKKGAARGRGSHLSATGVMQARQIGADLGVFDLVLTSTIPRTLETALAMGFAVDEQIESLGAIPVAVWDEIGHHERWSWPDPFVRFAELMALNGPTAQLGLLQRATWAAGLEQVPADGRVLVISHGRVIESGLVAALPDGAFAAWGAPFRHCEGATLSYDGRRFSNVVLRRSPVSEGQQPLT